MAAPWAPVSNVGGLSDTTRTKYDSTRLSLNQNLNVVSPGTCPISSNSLGLYWTTCNVFCSATETRVTAAFVRINLERWMCTSMVSFGSNTSEIGEFACRSKKGKS